jgi:hypothetical protein
MSENKQEISVYSEDFIAKIAQFKTEMTAIYDKISEETTPHYDGDGNKIVDTRPDGLDYIIAAYMSKKLDKHFPGWSWQDGHIQILGSFWVISDGTLYIIDEHLLAFGITPPYRKFYSSGAARIQYKRNTPYAPENIVDIDKNIKSANTNAFKFAINRLCRIGDDVYKKRLDLEGAVDELEELADKNPSIAQKVFMEYLSKRKINPQDVFKVLGVNSLASVSDYNEALNKMKEAGY